MFGKRKNDEPNTPESDNKPKRKIGPDGELITPDSQVKQREITLRIRYSWIAMGLVTASVLIAAAFALLVVRVQTRSEWGRESVAPVFAMETPLPFATNTLPVNLEATPTSRISFDGGTTGYPLITRVQVGQIPPNTRVRIGSMYYGMDKWHYTIATVDEIVAEATEDQLDYAPNVTPGATARSPEFQSYLGMGGYVIITREQVGPIPPNTRVRLSHAWLGLDEWMYRIVMEDETFADARESQLAWMEGVTPNAPTPTSRF